LQQVEYQLLSTLFPSSPLSALYGGPLLSPSLSSFSSTCAGINALLKKSLNTSISIAFETFSDLSSRQDAFDELVRTKGGRKENELGEALHAFRGSCLRGLGEFIEDVKVCFDAFIAHRFLTEDNLMNSNSGRRLFLQPKFLMRQLAE
jgi:exocyst complex component 7